MGAYCSQEESLSHREYCGTYQADELRDYFEGVQFELDEKDWLEIGLGRTAARFSFLTKAKKISAHNGEHSLCINLIKM